jgi:hypothetical protein
MLRASIYLLWILLLCGAASASAQTPHRVKPQKAAATPSSAQPQATAVAPPAPAVTPEHGPSSPPQVSLQGGQLTIVARNSTMSDVLNAVRQKTGANVDMPAGSGERVVGQFGPGAPRDVMAQLLNGSHYDYVLLGSAADPHALNKIVLMAKSNGPEPAPTAQANQPQGANENLQAVPEVESENPVENGGEATPNMQEQSQEEPQADQGDQSQDQQNGPVGKTPEQLLRELQQQQQQQQQQNQSGPPGAPGQPPQ